MNKNTLKINDVLFVFPTDFIQALAAQKCGESYHWTAVSQVETMHMKTLAEEGQLKISVKTLQLSLKDGCHVCLLEQILRCPKGESVDKPDNVTGFIEVNTDNTVKELQPDNEVSCGQVKRKRGRPRKLESEKQKNKVIKKCTEVPEVVGKSYTLRGVKLSAEIMNAEKGIYLDNDAVKTEAKTCFDEPMKDKPNNKDSMPPSVDEQKGNEDTENGPSSAGEVDLINSSYENVNPFVNDDGDSDYSELEEKPRRKRGRPRQLKKRDDTSKTKRCVIDIGDVPRFERRKRREQKKEQCKVCGKKLCDYTGLFDHVKKRHCDMEGYQNYLEELKELKVVTCEICQQKFADRTLLHAHEDREHRQNEIVECFHCKKPFRGIVHLRSHIRSVHIMQGDRSKLCHLCPAKFKWAVSLRQHIDEIHEGNKHAKCELCGKTFYSNSQLRRHERCHGLHKSKCVICQQCGKQFLFAHNLKRHVEAMHGTRQEIYHCSYCGKGFRLKTSMVSHVLLVHFSMFSFSCKECRASFPRSKFLIDHMASVHNIKDFQVKENRKERYKYAKDDSDLFYCSYCSTGFHYKAKLVDHIHTSHAEIFPHRCDICKQGFLEASFLDNHRLKSHSVADSDATDVLQQINDNGVVTIIHNGDGEKTYITSDAVTSENTTEVVKEIEYPKTVDVTESVEAVEPAMTDTAAASLLVEVARGSKTYRYYIETPEGTAADGSVGVNPQDIASLLLMAEQTIEASVTNESGDGHVEESMDTPVNESENFQFVQVVDDTVTDEGMRSDNIQFVQLVDETVTEEGIQSDRVQFVQVIEEDNTNLGEEIVVPGELRDSEVVDPGHEQILIVREGTEEGSNTAVSGTNERPSDLENVESNQLHESNLNIQEVLNL